MPRGSIIDSIALAHELTCHINNGHPGGNIIMKIDMSKAYDQVSWLFLLRMMQALGFKNTWCDLIYRLISNCWYPFYGMALRSATSNLIKEFAKETLYWLAFLLFLWSFSRDF
ncbi:hypothetical protein QQ045_014623 [Rhodiola kirilowii]